MWFEALWHAMQQQLPVDNLAFSQRVEQWGQDWVHSNATYPDTASGDAFILASSLAALIADVM